MDSPVMILFFNRPDLLKQVFEAVKQAQPKTLFLVQDGPRPCRADDGEKVLKCREIVAEIDWPCQVYRNYSEINLSCDHREYTGISWCFEYVDRLIILEDDCVPSQSFFQMCDLLLEQYKDNNYIHSISGFNRINTYPSKYDYLFSKSGAGWGWATWRRVWEKADKIKDYVLEDTAVDRSTKFIYGDLFDQAKKYRSLLESTGRIPSWEFLFGATLVLNDMLVITPTKNMVKYIGISADATHCASDARLLTHKVRKVLTQTSYEISFPLKHPPFIVRDTKFERLSTKSMKSPKLLTSMESALLKIRYGEWGLLKQSIMRRIKK